MSESRRDGGRAVAALLLSVATHLSLTLLGEPRASSMAESAPLAPPILVDVELELPELGAANGGETTSAPLGGDAMPRPDSGRAGLGGTAEVDEAAVNLAPRDDEAHLAPELRSRIDRAQEARTRTGAARRAPEDDRVSPSPMILTFVSDGPAISSRMAAQRASTGGRDDIDEKPSPTGAAHIGGGAAPLWNRDGVLHGTGEAETERSAASVRGLVGASAHEASAARPMTVRGDESSPADDRGEQQDTVDSEQEVVALDQSMLRASTAGGQPSAGRGGSQGGGAPGAGGTSGPGSRASPLGSGSGTGVGVDPADARRRLYLRTMWMRIQGSWTADDFPRQAAIEGKQGHTIVSFTVLHDGSVMHVRILRPSGFPEFDRKMVRAVMRAAPFGALPRELGPVLHRTHDFVVSNPAVRPPHR